MAAKTGRPSKKTPEREALLLEAFELGASQTLACKIAGLSPALFRDWRDSDPDFAARVEAAEGKAGLEALRTLREAMANRTWQAAAWFLERRFPSEYGRDRKEPEANAELAVVELPPTKAQTWEPPN